jgi:hypothetical protein
MRSLYIVTWLLGGVLVGSVQSARSDGAAEGTNPAQVRALTPGLDDLMTLLVQPRHLRLNAAGTRRNWELAAFELEELRSALRRTAQAIPQYQGEAVDEAVKAVMNPSLEKTRDAIEAADAQRFKQAFGELTSACNACHTFMEHPFLVIKVPEAKALTPYEDQEFAQTPRQ